MPKLFWLLDVVECEIDFNLLISVGELKRSEGIGGGGGGCAIERLVAFGVDILWRLCGDGGGGRSVFFGWLFNDNGDKVDWSLFAAAIMLERRKRASNARSSSLFIEICELAAEWDKAVDFDSVCRFRRCSAAAFLIASFKSSLFIFNVFPHVGWSFLKNYMKHKS